MRKAIFIIVALFSMSVFSSCDEPEFTTSDSENVINNDDYGAIRLITAPCSITSWAYRMRHIS